MAPPRASRRAQRGLALIALLAVAVLAFAYVLTSRLNAASMFVGIDREHNAQVLARAKQALIGYVAQQASLAGEDNPGRLPCPEAGAFFGDPAQEGIAAGNCTLPAVGRLPWRTLGLEKLVDAGTEPLWYVVSPGWALSNSTVPPLQTLINSDSIGQLAVDGVPNDSVALIIAPGAAMAVQAGAGCAAWVQTRPAAGPPDRRNYLECGNVSGTFATAAPGSTFNDQVLRVTAADIVPALEAAIAHRMQREIVPALCGVYGEVAPPLCNGSAQWGGNPLFPYPAPFSDPGTSNYQGVAATAGSDRPRGLLPFTSSDSACGVGPRCSTTFVTWNTAVAPTVSISGAISYSGSCTFPNTSTVRCTGTYLAPGTVTLRMSVRADNVAMALRQLDPSRIIIEHGLASCGSPGPGSAASAVFQGNGSADLTLQGTAPGLLGPLPLLLPLSTQFCMTADLGVLSDHPLLDSTSTGPGSTGWFVRNEWYRLTYYAVALKNTAFGMPPPLSCNAVPNCLSRNFPTPSMNNVRALIILAGRSMSGMARPNGSLGDYLEFENNDGDLLYEQRPVSRVINAPLMSPFNDRVLVVDTN